MANDIGLAYIMTQAYKGTAEVVEATFKKLSLPPPTQEKLRVAFDEAMKTPEGAQALQQLLGAEEFDRQMSLALDRRRWIERNG